MRVLETEFKKAGRIFKQVWRNKLAALYEVDIQGKTYYEVFKIGYRKERELAGRILEEGEIYPSDEQFGSVAWCCGSVDSLDFILNEKQQILKITDVEKEKIIELAKSGEQVYSKIPRF